MTDFCQDYPPPWCYEDENIPPAWRAEWDAVKPWGDELTGRKWQAHCSVRPVEFTPEEAVATGWPTRGEARKRLAESARVPLAPDPHPKAACTAGDLAWMFFETHVRRAGEALRKEFLHSQKRVAEAAKSNPAPQTTAVTRALQAAEALREEFRRFQALEEEAAARGEPAPEVPGKLRALWVLSKKGVNPPLVVPFAALAPGNEPPPAETVAEDLATMGEVLEQALALQEVLLHRVGELALLGLSVRVGGHKGQRHANDPAKTEARVRMYRDWLRRFYAANPGGKWQAAVASIADADPAQPTAEAVRKFLARHKVTAADFGA